MLVLSVLNWRKRHAKPQDGKQQAEGEAAKGPTAAKLLHAGVGVAAAGVGGVQRATVTLRARTA